MPKPKSVSAAHLIARRPEFRTFPALGPFMFAAAIESA